VDAKSTARVVLPITRRLLLQVVAVLALRRSHTLRAAVHLTFALLRTI